MAGTRRYIDKPYRTMGVSNYTFWKELTDDRRNRTYIQRGLHFAGHGADNAHRQRRHSSI